MASGSVEEDQMSVDEFEAFEKKRKYPLLLKFRKQSKKYSRKEVEELMSSYQSFAEQVVSARYDAKVSMPSATEWFNLNS